MNLKKTSSETVSDAPRHGINCIGTACVGCKVASALMCENSSLKLTLSQHEKTLHNLSNYLTLLEAREYAHKLPTKESEVQ